MEADNLSRMKKEKMEQFRKFLKETKEAMVAPSSSSRTAVTDLPPCTRVQAWSNLDLAFSKCDASRGWWLCRVLQFSGQCAIEHVPLNTQLLLSNPTVPRPAGCHSRLSVDHLPEPHPVSKRAKPPQAEGANTAGWMTPRAHPVHLSNTHIRSTFIV